MDCAVGHQVVDIVDVGLVERFFDKASEIMFDSDRGLQDSIAMRWHGYPFSKTDRHGGYCVVNEVVV